MSQQNASKQQPTNQNSKSMIRNSTFFVSFDDLPGEHDLDLDFYQQRADGCYGPSHHWCLIGEIIDVMFFIRPRCDVRDIKGAEFRVHFYLDKQNTFDSNILTVGSLICLRYAAARQFMDLSTGIRVEDENLPFLQIIPKLSLSKLLAFSDNGSIIDYYNKNILKIANHQIENNQCWYKNCGKTGNEKNVLSRCGCCNMARYCCKDHQVKHWKSQHKHQCKHLFPKIKKLFAIDLSNFKDYKSF